MRFEPVPHSLTLPLKGEGMFFAAGSVRDPSPGGGAFGRGWPFHAMIAGQEYSHGR